MNKLLVPNWQVGEQPCVIDDCCWAPLLTVKPFLKSSEEVSFFAARICSRAGAYFVSIAVFRLSAYSSNSWTSIRDFSKMGTREPSRLSFSSSSGTTVSTVTFGPDINYRNFFNFDGWGTGLTVM